MILSAAQTYHYCLERVMDLDLTLTVAQLVLRYPAAVPILTSAGVDTCCDSGLSLAGAAARAGISLNQLVVRLHDGIGQGPEARTPNGCACQCEMR
jgi:iron-sulfur cluster repair protein YtfE (RIC family)